MVFHVSCIIFREDQGNELDKAATGFLFFHVVILWTFFWKA